MSYILDALNKVEQANRSREKPNLEAIAKPTRPRWPAVLLILISVNVCWLVYLNWPAPEQSGSPTVAPSPRQEIALAVDPIVDSVVVSKPGAAPPSSNVSAVRISELPVQIQRQIPDMTFSSHIHAADPSLRMVNINGRNYFSGDKVADGIHLQEITEDGVVLRFLHYTFEVSVIRDWAFN